MRLTHRLAAQAIRRHFWQPDGGRWTMGRELRIFDGLCEDYDPLELVGAIAHVRECSGTRGPIHMTWLIHPQRGTALLSRAVAAFHAAQPIQTPPGPQRGGGFARISVELPPPNPSEGSQ